MSERFTDYAWECLRETPGAFRRGMLAVTLLANLVLVTALLLGWHLNAFTALQMSTAAACIAVLEIILILPYRLWKSNKAEITRLRTEGGPFPDWTIKELFEFIRPGDLTERDNYERVGSDVLDRLSTGQLVAWGRPMQKNGFHPLQSIPASFWHNAYLTYFFIAENHQDAVHAGSGNILDDISYSDVRVNRAHAMRIWGR